MYLYKNMANEIAIFGAGCFWHVEYEFSKLPGVIKTEVGFMGDDKSDDISYEKVSTGKTGNIEVTKITFDNKKISYEELINTFWKIHNPTTLNRQGPDIGEQYKSVIFYFKDKQGYYFIPEVNEYWKNKQKEIVDERNKRIKLKEKRMNK